MKTGSYIGKPDCIGKGLAPKALTSFLQQYVFHNFDACLVDPEKNNKAAIKAYAKAGFSTFRDLDSSIIMIAHREERSKITLPFNHICNKSTHLRFLGTCVTFMV